MSLEGGVEDRAGMHGGHDGRDICAHEIGAGFVLMLA